MNSVLIKAGMQISFNPLIRTDNRPHNTDNRRAPDLKLSHPECDIGAVSYFEALTSLDKIYPRRSWLKPARHVGRDRPFFPGALRVIREGNKVLHCRFVLPHEFEGAKFFRKRNCAETGAPDICSSLAVPVCISVKIP